MIIINIPWDDLTNNTDSLIVEVREVIVSSDGARGIDHTSSDFISPY